MSPSPFSKLTIRKLHRTIAPIVLLPLIITVTTGMTYRIGKDWFGWTRDQAHILMVIHEGEYFGDQGKSIYVLLNGLGLIVMLATGATMLLNQAPWFRSLRNQWSQAKSSGSGESSGSEAASGSEVAAGSEALSGSEVAAGSDLDSTTEVDSGSEAKTRSEVDGSLV